VQLSDTLCSLEGGEVVARPGPTVQRRRLGVELRRLREQAGKTIEEVARALECSDSKVSRIETGQVSATPRDVRDMLDLYGVRGDQRDALIQFTRQARQKGWWQAYSDTPVMPLVGLEAAADQIDQYEAIVVPGLLQTQDYARVVIRASRPDLPDEQSERWVEVRMARQRLLTQEHPPAFSVVLDECLLRRPVGGHEVLREQLGHLAEATALPSVTLQVLPLIVGEHAALSGGFTIYRFAEQADPDVVYLEHARGDLYFINNAEEVKRYASAFDSLRTLALDPDDSAALLANLSQEL
jgi:transcriptional regulator with XRE-family HTH domain